jgi:hypothetical protein
MDQNGFYAGGYSAPRSLWQRFRKPLIVLITVAALILVAVITFNLVNPTPRKTADKFLGYVKANKASDSYSLFTVNAKRFDTIESWTATVDNLSPYFTGKNKFQSLEATNSTATKKVQDWTLTYNNTNSKGSFLLIVRVVKENGKWRVESFSSTPAATASNEE